MEALSFGWTTHQMKFHLAREEIFIGLLVEFLNFPQKAAKQAAAIMTVWSATVLEQMQKYSSSVSLK